MSYPKRNPKGTVLPARLSGLSTHGRGVLLAAGAMLLISPDGLMIRLSGPDELVLLFWRAAGALAGAALLLVMLRPGGVIGALRKLDRPTLVFAALMVVSNALFVGSISRTAVANTLVILAAVPLFGGILGWIVLREKVPLRTWLAIAAALAGILIIVGGSFDTGNLLGDGLAVASAFLLATKLVLIRRFPKTDILGGMGLSAAATMLVLTPFAAPLAGDTASIYIPALTGFFALAVAAVMFFMSARYLPPAETGLFALLETVLGPIWVWLALDEAPPLATIAGGTVVLITLALHSLASTRRTTNAPDKKLARQATGTIP